MTSTQRFIEDMAAGDFIWNGKPVVKVEFNEHTGMVALWYRYENGGGDYSGVPIQALLLRPDVWQAVGKTRGWRERSEGTFEAEYTCWQAYWTGFYQHLADGKTIEAALSDIEGTKNTPLQ